MRKKNETSHTYRSPMLLLSSSAVSGYITSDFWLKANRVIEATPFPSKMAAVSEDAVERDQG